MQIKAENEKKLIGAGSKVQLLLVALGSCNFGLSCEVMTHVSSSSDGRSALAGLHTFTYLGISMQIVLTAS